MTTETDAKDTTGTHIDDFGELPGGWEGGHQGFDFDEEAWCYYIDFWNDDADIPRETSETGDYWAYEITVGRMYDDEELVCFLDEAELDSEGYHTGMQERIETHLPDTPKEAMEIALEIMNRLGDGRRPIVTSMETETETISVSVYAETREDAREEAVHAVSLKHPNSSVEFGEFLDIDSSVDLGKLLYIDGGEEHYMTVYVTH